MKKVVAVVAGSVTLGLPALAHANATTRVCRVYAGDTAVTSAQMTCALARTISDVYEQDGVRLGQCAQTDNVICYLFPVQAPHSRERYSINCELHHNGDQVNCYWPAYPRQVWMHWRRD